MPIVFLKPTSQTDTGVNVATGVLTDVDEGVAGADANLEVSVGKQWATPFFVEYGVEDLPGDADSIISVKLRIRARITGTWIDDSIQYNWTVVGTGMSGQVQWDFENDFGAGLANREVTTTGSPTVANVNAALIRVTQAYSGSMAKEDITHDWDCLELEVDYDTGGGNVVLTADPSELTLTGAAATLVSTAFGDLVKSDSVDNTSLTTFSPDLGSNPASGNLLITTVCAGSAAALISTPPSGFTLLHASTTGSGTWYWYYKISVGTEQTISAVWDAAINGVMHYVEYAWDGSTPAVIKNENTDNISSTTNSQPSGAATPTEATNLCLAMHATDGNQNSSTNQAMDGSWIEDITFFSNDQNQAEGKLSRLVNAALSSQEATHTDTDADQMFGAIAIFDAGADDVTLTGNPGSLVLTGATADLIASIDVILVADPGALALSGAIATLIGTDNKVLQAEPGALILTGATADLLVSDNVILVADPSQLTLTGAAATLTASDAPVLIARRGGVRFIREPEPETRAKKLIELKALVKPQAAPDSSDGTITQKMALVVPKSKQRRVERLLAETGITLEELLIILN